MERLKIFFLKTFIIAMPLLLIIAVYFITDPFKVLHTYHFENYYGWQHWELNREMTGITSLKERFAKNDTPMLISLATRVRWSFAQVSGSLFCMTLPSLFILMPHRKASMVCTTKLNTWTVRIFT